MGLIAAQHGDDRDPGSSSRPRVSDRLPVERARRAERKPVDGEPFDIALKLGEVLRDLRHAEEFGEGPAVLGPEAQQVVRRVGIVAFEQHELAHAGTVVDDGDPVPVVRDELVANADPGERDLVHDRHRVLPAARDRSELVELPPELRHVIGVPPPFPEEHQHAASPCSGEPDHDVEESANSRMPSVITAYPTATSAYPTFSTRLLGVVRAGDRSRVSMGPR